MNFYSPEKIINISSLNSAFINRADESFYFSGEMHDFWEMVYCKSGCINVSEDDRIYELQEGQVIFHKPLEFHKIWAKKGYNADVIIISFSDSLNNLTELGNGVFNLDIPMSQMLIETFEEITSTFNCTTFPVSRSDATALEENIAILKFELFLLNIIKQITPSKTQSKSVRAKNYKKIINVMKTNIDNNLSVDEIAKLCFLSTANLKKTFKLYSGLGVKEYYNKLRIIRACKLLQSGMRVGEVSEKMCFSSPNYFTVTFKKEMGLSPIQYIN